MSRTSELSGQPLWTSSIDALVLNMSQERMLVYKLPYNFFSSHKSHALLRRFENRLCQCIFFY